MNKSIVKVTSDFTNDSGVPFCAVRVEPGEPFGNIVRLIPYDGPAAYSQRLIADRPLVEFYDRRFRHTDLGQFVTRYYVETLVDRLDERGLLLDAGIDDWRISADNLRLVRDQLFPQGE